MAHPDPGQKPTKGQPWSSLLSQTLIHKVDLIVPKESMTRLQGRLALERWSPVYYRVTIRLGDILNDDLFTQYIKTGNICMMSEGRIDTDDVFKITDGTLTMYLRKETYERAGLVGRPHGSKGKRGLKPRWFVQYDLRGPASSPGKKGFDRLIHACKHTLDQPVTWLSVCLAKRPSPDPLLKYSPVVFTSSPSISEGMQVRMPTLKPSPDMTAPGGRMSLEGFSTEVYEWLSMLRLQSPRINTEDKIDPYLARYDSLGNPDRLEEVTLHKISWEGFFKSPWACQLLVDVILATSSPSWFALSATTVCNGTPSGSYECTVLRPPNSPGEYILWNIHSHSD